MDRHEQLSCDFESSLVSSSSLLTCCLLLVRFFLFLLFSCLQEKKRQSLFIFIIACKEDVTCFSWFTSSHSRYCSSVSISRDLYSSTTTNAESNDSGFEYHEDHLELDPFYSLSHPQYLGLESWKTICQ